MPVTIELEPGTYWWCSCGKSNDLPFYKPLRNRRNFAGSGLQPEPAMRFNLILMFVRNYSVTSNLNLTVLFSVDFFAFTVTLQRYNPSTKGLSPSSGLGLHEEK